MPFWGTSTIATRAFDLAVAEADYIKNNNLSRIIGLGVGGVTDSATNLDRLKALVSNFTSNPGGPVSNVYYFLANTFDLFRDAVDAITQSDAFC